MTFSAADVDAMRRALSLAKRGIYTTEPNPRVGCVLVRDDQIVGEGWHQRAGEAHAEVNALQQAGEAAQGATAYVSLEPCSHQGRTGPCCVALAEAGVKRVVAAVQDPNPAVAGKGLAYLAEQGVDVAHGLLAEEAEALNRGFFSRMRRGRPWLTVKLAASLDGRTAMASGESRWISGAASRDDVHRRRAWSSVVMSGSGTVLADNPRLDARLAEPCRQPRRVILDSTLQTPPDARLFESEAPLLLVCGEQASEARAAALEQAGAEIWRLSGQRPDLRQVLEALAQSHEVNEVMLEAGPKLAGVALSAGLVDEICLYLAPHLMGDAARGLFHLPGLAAMEDRVPLEIVDVRRLGEDIRLLLRPGAGGAGE
ncbi:diaminohydroxyphosphoribosylaminopyrimidine deaminase/5-amino-6-(5-phosphoribosylamino)uracil reductase [Natronospira proteinivora]|uniref:Riboflavin biosynthesis protein RibD n=1 Tax=Natronospira proteinivora TaxID=1807133 RepID=A0ABT1G767_9GAMM|nr:bifunctional diaminohydroxyphosphoribosylaminopyrimidine deaminase/5-amino-6-(5-phosphoribosylamino)uracil reductase RibD [Natronospira proteinivora]MCP1727144.1 diaminohydroxyphosphoribosylaminopyrimidine deaminase/5-amino-6-(5-phosphoribosylamino)uracil reductase [Natronospira proteinivora]